MMANPIAGGSRLVSMACRAASAIECRNLRRGSSMMHSQNGLGLEHITPCRSSGSFAESGCGRNDDLVLQQGLTRSGVIRTSQPARLSSANDPELTFGG